MATDLRQVILEASRPLFFEKGYKGVHMRMIASGCGVSPGNIYNYFENKDCLFEEILKPALHGLAHLNYLHNEDERISDAVFDNVDLCMFNELNALFDHCADELKLLFFHSQGSKYENYREVFISNNEVAREYYIAAMKEKYPEMNASFTRSFIRSRCADWFSVISELVQHPDMSEQERKRFLREYILYSASGWKRLMTEMKSDIQE